MRKIEYENSDTKYNLQSYVALFLENEILQNLNTTTLKHHRSILERFVKGTAVDSIRMNGIKEIETFFAHCLNKTAMSEFTKKSYFNVIKKFFLFLKGHHVVEQNVIDAIDENRFLLPDVKPFFFEEDDERKLFDVLKTKPRNRGGEVFERNVMIIKLMRFAGLRPREVREVRINDIYDNGRRVFHIPIGERVHLDEDSSLEEEDLLEATIAMEYIEKELAVLKEKGYLYLCEAPKSKRILTTDEIGNMSKVFQKKAGIKKPLGLMVYRHTYIKELCLSGLEADTIRKKVRLSSKRTIMNYFHALNLKTPKELNR